MTSIFEIYAKNQHINIYNMIFDEISKIATFSVHPPENPAKKPVFLKKFFQKNCKFSLTTTKCSKNYSNRTTRSKVINLQFGGRSQIGDRIKEFFHTTHFGSNSPRLRSSSAASRPRCYAAENLNQDKRRIL